MRNYKKEYQNYHSTPKQKKDRASRNAARAKLMKRGAVSKGDGKDVDHKNGKPRQNNDKNLRVKPKSANRSFPRTKTARKR